MLYWLSIPILRLHDIQTSKSLFLPNNFQESLGTISYIPRETLSADITATSLGHAILSAAQLG